ncbi:MAG: DUF1614 domain-containing protein [Bacillota bacterium]|nr:DUF1614 domain-containing protein [Bacillota bacterium]
MPWGSVLLLAVAVLIYLGAGHRVLDRMRLSDRAALVVLLVMAAGSLVNFRLVPPPRELVINVGGGLVPLGISVYLLATTDTTGERGRGTLAALLAGGAVYLLGRILPPEEQTMWIDPAYVFGPVAGLIAYLAGRSRRAAFAAGATGTILADLGHWVEGFARPYPTRTWVGGAGAFDAVVIAALLAVALAELAGELRERVAPRPPSAPPSPGPGDRSPPGGAGEEGEQR